jgi:hypothetical protein
MKAKFIGDPRTPGEANNLPESTSAFGIDFPRGKFVDVPAELEAKFEGNTHFETKAGAASKTAEPEPAASETIPDLEARIASVDDADALRAELEGETRKGAVAALEARIAELEEA